MRAYPTEISLGTSISLGLPEDCVRVAKRDGVDIYIALESNLICLSVISYMKTKVDIVSFTVNNVLLIGP